MIYGEILTESFNLDLGRSPSNDLIEHDSFSEAECTSGDWERSSSILLSSVCEEFVFPESKISIGTLASIRRKQPTTDLAFEFEVYPSGKYVADRFSRVIN